MEDRSSQRRFRDVTGNPVSLPIGGMKTAVVTVTGYFGIERFDLIKLITKAGGNYVGRMSPSITHLVCWKYEGTKFQIARKYNHKIFIVNHKWIEDCVKAGKRLPEEPYTRQCGYEVGPLKFDASLISELSRYPNLHNDRKEPGELHATQSLRSLEKRTSASPESSHGGRRRRLVRKSALKQPLIISSDSEEEITGQEAFHVLHHDGAVSEFSDLNDEIKMNATEGLVSLETSNSDLAEPSHRVRRLVKKNKTKETSNISQSRERSTRLEDFQQPSTIVAVSFHSGPENECRLSDLHAGGSTNYECGQNRTESSNDDPTLEVNDVLASDDPSLTVMRASPDHFDDKNENRKDTEPMAILPTPTELSCVICWTNFSTTRGVLPCGHRFCYSCIQSWADHKTASQKASTCPLCKAVFSSITKVDDAVSSDQKIYSQTVPDDDYRVERIHFLSGAETPSIPSHLALRFVAAAIAGNQKIFSKDVTSARFAAFTPTASTRHCFHGRVEIARISRGFTSTSATEIFAYENIPFFLLLYQLKDSMTANVDCSWVNMLDA